MSDIFSGKKNCASCTYCIAKMCSNTMHLADIGCDKTYTLVKPRDPACPYWRLSPKCVSHEMGNSYPTYRTPEDEATLHDDTAAPIRPLTD